MQDDAFSDIKKAEDWERIREARRQEFLQCLGLTRLPNAEDLNIHEKGEVLGIGFRARKIAFQLLPDCWGSAMIYYPDPLPAKPAPSVLYVCGHEQIGLWACQHCGILWARRGYVCLIVDTLEQHDNHGEHHGFRVGLQSIWLANGYTSAGGETWNSLCALEVLLADPTIVDPQRVGVTGISGGGALSFYLAILDKRIKAVSSLCGLSTAWDAIANRRLLYHCDCIYPYNIFGRDISEYAALIAPRAALFCSGENDALYSPKEVAAFVERTRKIYSMQRIEERCALLEHSCAHVDDPVFLEATQRWFDRYVAGEAHPILTYGEKELSKKETSVFQGALPERDFLHLLPELLSKKGRVPLPQSPRQWLDIQKTTLKSLPQAPVESSHFQMIHSWEQGDSAQSRHVGEINGMEISLEIFERGERQKLLIGIAESGESFRHPLTRLDCAGQIASVAGFEPRLAAGNFPAMETSPFPTPWQSMGGVRTQLQRAMALTGQTPVMMTAADLKVLIDYLATSDKYHSYEIYLYGRCEGAAAALYHAVQDPRIQGVVLENLPSSYRENIPVLGILQILDIPETLGLMAPRKVVLVHPGHNNWVWPEQAFEYLNCSHHFAMYSDLHSGIEHVLQ